MFSFNLFSKSIILFLLVGCYSCNSIVHTNEFIGIYKIDKTVLLDPNSPKAHETFRLEIILSEDNNFQLYGTGKNIIGYWRAENNGEEYQLLFQGGGVTTTARFNGNIIYFDRPDKLLDSILSW